MAEFISKQGPGGFTLFHLKKNIEETENYKLEISSPIQGQLRSAQRKTWLGIQIALEA